MEGANGTNNELKRIAEREIQRMEEAIKDVTIVDNKGLEIYNLSLSYLTDAKHFFKKQDFIRAFEAVVIAWAYIDAGLHFEVFKIPEKHKKLFTIGD